MKAGTGMDAQHPHVFLPNAHTHAHSRNSKRLGKAGRRGAALYKAWHAASSSSAQETGRDIIAYKGKTSGSYGSSCLPVPASAAQRQGRLNNFKGSWASTALKPGNLMF